MPIGSVIFQTVKVGSMDLLNSEARFSGIDIYEAIDDPFGHPVIEINFIDPIDAINKEKITGSYDSNEIEIKFKYEPTGEVIGFKSKMHSLENQSDRMGDIEEGSGHSKEGKIKGIQPEFFRSQRPVEKAFSGPTTKHVEEIFKEISDKQIQTDAPSEPRDKTHGRGKHTIDVVNGYLKEHVSSRYKSSAYVIFQKWVNGQSKIVQTTYEQLFEQSPVATLRERTDLNTTGITEQDQQNSIIYARYSPSWSEPRALSKTVKKSFNYSTHTVVDQNYQDDTKTKTPAYSQPASYVNTNDSFSAEDTFNNSQQHTLADANRRRKQFISHLMQGEATIEVPGNPKITLGSIVNLEIPKKTDDNSYGGEGQFNKTALVVAIRHKLKPAGQSPRYTMVLELVKGGMVQGGQTA